VRKRISDENDAGKEEGSTVGSHVKREVRHEVVVDTAELAGGTVHATEVLELEDL
jgi:hypothetical protein